MLKLTKSIKPELEKLEVEPLVSSAPAGHVPHVSDPFTPRQNRKLGGVWAEVEPLTLEPQRSLSLK